MKKWLASLSFLMFSLALFSPLVSHAEEEPLPPSEAFQASAVVKDSKTLTITWKIADKYYLYHKKFKFQSDTKDVTLGTPVIPAGHAKQDPYFGQVETHRNTISIDLPYTNSGQTTTLALTVGSQGCADLGLCYPPYEQKLTITLPSAVQGATAIKAVKKLGANLGLEEEEFLTPDKAFILSTQKGNNQKLIAQWKIADGYYMYRNKFKFKLKSAADGVTLGKIEMPAGDIKDDEYFGRIQVYHKNITTTIPILGDLKGKPVTIELVYQGCADAGLCYPPIFKTVTYDPAASATSTTGSAPADKTITKTETTSTENISDDEMIANLFKAKNLPSILFALLGFGLLLAFTACMYPMIPIVSSIIVGHGEKVTVMKGFTLSLVYVLSMALTFGVIGAIFGYTGEASNIAAQMQKPWVLVAFASLFVLLSLSMFGFYNIQIPSALQSRLNDISNKQKSGSMLGVFVMGVLSALIIGPCGGPVLIATIAGAAASNDPVLGFLYMFTLAIGMGAPLLVVGAGGGKILPHAGTWMDNVKAAAGVLLLAVAIVFLERVLSSVVYMSMWAALFIITATYMGAFENIPEGSSGWKKLFKGIGLIVFIYGVIVLLGGLTGARNFNDPLHGSKLLGGASSTMLVASPSGNQPAYVEFAKGKKTTNKGGLTFIKVKTVADFNRELKNANKAGKTVMLDFYADWCTYCKQFDDYVFSDPAVQKALHNTVILEADITDQDAEDKAMLKYVNVITAPAILFFSTDGKEVRKQRVLGLMKADEFLQRVSKSFK